MDSRPFVALPDGGAGAIDNWEMTARFKETTPWGGYGNRQICFEVDIRWLGGSSPGELMRGHYLEDRMGFVSPSGGFAELSLIRASTQGSSGYETRYRGLAINNGSTLPDEAGTFYLIFTPHPYKHFLVWTVYLPYLPTG